MLLYIMGRQKPNLVGESFSGGGGNVQYFTVGGRKLGHADHVLPSGGKSLEEGTVGHFVKLPDEGCVVFGRRGRVHHGVGQGVLCYVS